MEEIKDASKRLKENKTSADGWIPCMITLVSGILFNILLCLTEVKVEINCDGSIGNITKKIKYEEYWI